MSAKKTLTEQFRDEKKCFFCGEKLNEGDRLDPEGVAHLECYERIVQDQEFSWGEGREEPGYPFK